MEGRYAMSAMLLLLLLLLPVVAPPTPLPRLLFVLEGHSTSTRVPAASHRMSLGAPCS